MHLLVFLGSILAKDINFDYHNWVSDVTVPVVVNCNDSGVNQRTLEQAVLYWQSKGKSVRGVKRRECLELNKKGEIRIFGELEKLDTQNYFAMTYLIKNGNENIVSAHISFAKDSLNNTEVIYHELGHALGIPHDMNNQRSLMHPQHNYYLTEF